MTNVLQQLFHFDEERAFVHRAHADVLVGDGLTSYNWSRKVNRDGRLNQECGL